MIEEFSGNYRWLSNFWLCPISKGEWVYPSTENAYQAMKYPKDQRSLFISCSPSKAKRLGQVIDKPADWEERKLLVMKKLLEQKFSVGTYNGSLLLSTGDQEIVEGNTWGDTFWGVCNDVGENNLGKLLMGIRDNLNASNAS